MLPGSLSPSRASDFMQCALLYRFRVIDRLPEPPTSATARGTLVHSVLEHLFDAPRADRTLETAISLLPSQWTTLIESQPEILSLIENEGSTIESWLEQAQTLIESYFDVEDPQRFDPYARELLVEYKVDDTLTLKGFVDRLDKSADGALRIVDYKTGKSPRDGFESKAMFQMRFYALVIWRSTGTIPSLLQILYLGNKETLRYTPDEQDLLAMERKVKALWQAIESAVEKQEFSPKKSALCNWCNHQALCPAFGGQPPTFPQPRSLDVVAAQPSDLD